MMRRLTALLLTLLTLLSLTACGGQSSDPPAEGPDAPDAGEGEPVEVLPPEPEPYTILDPTVMPEGGVRDGVTYVA